MHGTWHPSAQPAWLLQKTKNGKSAYSHNVRAWLKQHNGSKNEMVWSTPPHISGAILTGFDYEKFSLDPSSPPQPTVRCDRFFTEKENGLMQPWHGSLVFLNPPYVVLKSWIKKAIYEYQIQRAEKMVLLLPARFETAGMRELCAVGAGMFLLRDRLEFGTYGIPAPWPTAVYTLGATEEELVRLKQELPANKRMRFE